jgi:DNA-directed RNA polymerase specialized sigma24 family protein
VSFDAALVVSREKGADLVALDDALTALAAIDPRMSQVVELRFFGGLSVEDPAEVLKVSTDTVTSDWKRAKVWLGRRLDTRKGR